MKRLISILVFGTLLVLTGWLTANWLHKQVTLDVGAGPRPVSTWALTVGELLQSQGVALGAEDRVDPALHAPLTEGTAVRVTRARPVHVQVDGQIHTIWTSERNPGGMLDEVGVELAPADVLLVDGVSTDPDASLPPARGYALQVVRAVPVTVTLGARSLAFRSAAPTVGQALWEADVRLHAGDRVDPAPDTPITGPVQVLVDRSRPIVVETQHRPVRTRTTAETVGGALLEAGVPLQGLDYSIPAEGAPVPEDGLIQVVRVHEDVLIEGDPIPFETAYGPDPNMLLDERGVTNPGAYGMTAVRTRVRYENGEEISRAVERPWLALEPQPRVMGYGTRIEVRTVDTPQGELEYWRAAPMYATSYSPCRIFPDRCDSVTSSGATLRHGVAAVTLRNYRLMAYQRVYVPGYGVATILDVGGGIPGRPWIDLGYSDDNYQSWHHWVTVYFLTPVPPEEIIPYVLE